MTNREIREPKQKRSIDKKNKIVQAGYELFCEKGYYNTNTAEIAKRAGVSTGIVYNYFTDKKGIFFAVLDDFSTAITNTIFLELQTADMNINLEDAVNKIIDNSIEMHLSSKKAHEEMIAMSHLEADVKDYFVKFEENLIKMLADSLVIHGYIISNPHEKLHLAYDMVENYCHEVLYFKHKCVDNTVMKEIVAKTIVSILK